MAGLRGLYAALFLATTGLVGAWLATRGNAWSESWLPNLAAEAAGLLVTVAIVERIVRGQLQANEQARLAPLRGRGDGDQAGAPTTSFFFMVLEDWRNGITSIGEPLRTDDALEFVEGWRGAGCGVRLSRFFGWLCQWELQLDQTAQALGIARGRYLRPPSNPVSWRPSTSSFDWAEDEKDLMNLMNTAHAGARQRRTPRGASTGDR